MLLSPGKLHRLPRIKSDPPTDCRAIRAPPPALFARGTGMGPRRGAGGTLETAPSSRILLSGQRPRSAGGGTGDGSAHSTASGIGQYRHGTYKRWRTIR